MIDESLRNKIVEMRKNGLGYKKMAAELGMSRDRVRYIVKNMDKPSSRQQYPMNNPTCKYCGKMLHPARTGRPKKFCSDKCKNDYWKVHRDELNRNPEAIYIRECAYCGKTFESYGNRNRKYCCHPHYVLGHFGEKSSESACYCEASE